MGDKVWVWEVAVTPPGGRATVVLATEADAESARNWAEKALGVVLKGQEVDMREASIKAPDAKGYRTQVIADSSGQWVGNGLVFATVKEAQAYVRDLWSRWTLVQETRVIATDEEPTHFWSEDGKLGNLDRPEDARRPPRSVQL